MMSDKKESFGDTLLGCVLAFGLMYLLFAGEPSIYDSLRILMENYAEASNE